MIGGLGDKDLAYVVTTIAGFPEIDKAVLFGSRAKGTSKPSSDLDIAVFGRHVSFSTVSQLHWLLEEESPLPYFFDIVDYNTIGNLELRNHIDRVGIVIFERAVELSKCSTQQTN